jgi:hypothetical protein
MYWNFLYLKKGDFTYFEILEIFILTFWSDENGLTTLVRP